MTCYVSSGTLNSTNSTQLKPYSTTTHWWLLVFPIFEIILKCRRRRFGQVTQRLCSAWHRQQAPHTEGDSEPCRLLQGVWDCDISDHAGWCLVMWYAGASWWSSPVPLWGVRGGLTKSSWHPHCRQCCQVTIGKSACLDYCSEFQLLYLPLNIIILDKLVGYYFRRNHWSSTLIRLGDLPALWSIQENWQHAHVV